MFEKIKRYYNIGLYKEKHLLKLLDKKAITQEEYEKIILTSQNNIEVTDEDIDNTTID